MIYHTPVVICQCIIPFSQSKPNQRHSSSHCLLKCFVSDEAKVSFPCVSLPSLLPINQWHLYGSYLGRATMRERREGGKCCLLCWLTDEKEVVLVKMWVEEGRREEWKGFSYVFPSSVSTVKDETFSIEKRRKKPQSIYFYRFTEGLVCSWFENCFHLKHVKNTCSHVRICQIHLCQTTMLFMKKLSHLCPDSIIGYITHMSAEYIIRCISFLVLLWQ